MTVDLTSEDPRVTFVEPLGHYGMADDRIGVARLDLPERLNPEIKGFPTVLSRSGCNL